MDMKTKKSIEDLAGEGVRYESYDQLAEALNRMARRGHQYRISSSEMLRHANGTPDTTFRYRSLVLHCVHFGEPRRRVKSSGCGTRSAKYLATGCKSFFRITYRFEEEALVVTKSRLPHKGHKLEVTPVGRPQNYSTKYGKHRMKKALPKSSAQPAPKKPINPALELRLQTQKLNSLLKLQKKMHSVYSRNRAALGLPPYKFHPPPLKTDTLWYYFHLERHPFVDPVKPDEAEDGDIDVVGIDDTEVKVEEEEECPPEVNCYDEYGTEYDSADEGGDELVEEDEVAYAKDPNDEGMNLPWFQYDASFATEEHLETEVVNGDTSVYNENFFVETVDSIAI